MNVFSLAKPKSPLPLLFDSPHSGNQYPADFRYACDFKTLETAEDKYVDNLFDFTPEYGARLLLAHFPRSYIDVNRAVDDIDPDLLAAPWNGPSPINPTPRSHSGIGLIRRLVKPGAPVYNRKLSSAEILRRIETCYIPYHNALNESLKDLHYNFGQVWHINCHSMPAASAYPRQPVGIVGNRPRAVDFVLGDRDGTTCDPAFTRALRDFIKGLGYTVSLNDPFKGVECIDKYSNPALGYHALQIEINKALYMNENTGEKTENYTKLKSDLETLTAYIAEYVQSRLTAIAAD